MQRSFGSDARGRGFAAWQIQAVWEMATPVPGYSPALRRVDACGAYIDRYQYGVTAPNGTGWEIDHVFPVARGGGDDLSNLQPLQWENNRAKADSLQWTCEVTARAA